MNALKRAVTQFLNIPHRFVCLTDDPNGVDCETMAIPMNLPSWWGKIACFAPIWEDRVIFIDLDMIIRADITKFARRTEPFLAIKPFQSRPNGVASALLSIAPDYRRDIWDVFSNDPQGAIIRCHKEALPAWNNGDQRWLELMGAKPVYWQDIFPDQLVSYKYHCANGIPSSAAIIAFHGTPRPHEVKDPSVRELWLGTS